MTPPLAGVASGAPTATYIAESGPSAMPPGSGSEPRPMCVMDDGLENGIRTTSPRRAGRVRLEHLGRPEVALAVERAAVDGGKAARPQVRGGQEALVGVRVDPVHVRVLG